MALTINTNLSGINGQRNLQGSTTSLSTAQQRLSSGVKVNSAKDDAAGLAIADGMTSQVRGMTVAVRNAHDGVSLIQTAEGAFESLTQTLQRMRDLAVQSANDGAVSAPDREKMQAEFKVLNDELLRVVGNSEFNGRKILNGDLASGLAVQVGAGTDPNSRLSISVSNMTILLSPVTTSTLLPKNEEIDATFMSSITAASTSAAADTQLVAATDSAKLANAAVVAAKLAAASPNDLALAQAASAANLAASNAISASSANILATSDANKNNGLVPDAFLNSVTAANVASTAAATAIAGTDASIQSSTTTDADQANALLNTAMQLATAAADDVTFAGQNSYATTMNALTGDSLAVVDSSTTQTTSALNSAIGRAETGTFAADRTAQKAYAASLVAKAIATASYVEDPTKTQAENDTEKLAFVNNSKLVKDTSTTVNSISVDYSLASIRMIDFAIDLINTERANLGAMQNPFSQSITNLQSGIENQSAAKSRIMDADFAQETANLSRSQILQQAGTAMLAQANQSSQSVVTLLR